MRRRRVAKFEGGESLICKRSEEGVNRRAVKLMRGQEGSAGREPKRKKRYARTVF